MEIRVDIATATIADIFAYLLEAQGHSGIDFEKKNDAGFNMFPNVSCSATLGYRGICGFCIALRKYRLDGGFSEDDLLAALQGAHAP